MPAYNASKFIAPAVESIIGQTFQKFELIIVDDGSTDNTREIVSSYIEQDSRIKLILTDHAGVSHARNIGIEASNYDWIAMMDADDIAMPQRLEKQIAAANSNPRAIVWGTYAHHINSRGEILGFIRQGPTTEEEFYDYQKKGEIPFFLNSSGLFKKEILVNVGGYTTEFEIGTDFDLFERLAYYGPMLVIPEPLLLYRIHLQSESMKFFFLQRLSIRYVVKRHRKFIKENKLITYDQFVKAYNNQPLWSRLSRNLHTLGQFLYRKSGCLIGEKKYFLGIVNLLAAIILNPSYSLTGLWKRKFSPEARSMMKKSGVVQSRVANCYLSE